MYRVISVFLISFVFCASANAQIDVEKMADAIRRAEGNANYGVLTQYRHTSPRQACINTINHALRDYNGEEDGFITFLGSRYAPVGADNDPTNLNVNWVSNVSEFYSS